MRVLLFIPCLFFAGVVHAEPLSLSLPVDCADCAVVNYVDDDPEDGAARDFMCGARTYDGHNGTDFAVRDLVTMEMGVDVLAAASGKVLRLRDGMEDRIPSTAEREKLLAEDKGCGNGVFIDHGDGWQTIYCHMKKCSIAVKSGQKVKAGERLGQIGTSGASEFPHLHFGIFHDGKIVDPFTGQGTGGDCGISQVSLWDASAGVTYAPVHISAAGFRSAAPDYEALKIDAGTPARLPSDSAALVFWALLDGVAAGDRIVLEILGPDGATFSRREIVQDKKMARQFYFVGRKRKAEPWSSGAYTGTVRIDRGGDPGFDAAQTVLVAIE